jgi:hypothetical protein
MRLRDYAPRPAHLRWLLDSDPAIRWQAMRDLSGEAPETIAAERARVAREGWGARLLALQSPSGNWGGPGEDLGLLVTLYTLVVLKDLGLDPACKQARKMMERVDRRLVFQPLGNRPFLDGETEPCINGRILGAGSYFREPNDGLAERLLGEQLEDGGWNCEAWPFLPAKRPPSRRSSFHTTICVLEGLLDYERVGNRRRLLGLAKGARSICGSAGCSGRYAAGRLSTSGGCGSRTRRFGITMFCAGWIICGRRGLRRTSGCGRLSRS